MSTREELALSRGYKRVCGIPVVKGNISSVVERVHQGEIVQPVIFRGAASHWPACRRWDLPHLLERYGETEVRPTIGLPSHGVPYLVASASVRRRMNLKGFS